MVLILRTPGTDELNERWHIFPKKKIELSLKSGLCLEVIRDERGKISVKMCKQLLREFRVLFREAYHKRDGRLYYATIKRLHNLHKVVRYRALQLQVSDLLKEIQYLRKKHGRRWSVPEFFS
jgi:hypothetical protein